VVCPALGCGAAVRERDLKSFVDAAVFARYIASRRSVMPLSSSAGIAQTQSPVPLQPVPGSATTPPPPQQGQTPSPPSPTQGGRFLVQQQVQPIVPLPSIEEAVRS
jgi:hypothetical protein